MRDDRDDPFGDIFDEIERMIGGMAGNESGFGSETHVDVQEVGDAVRVVADLPGIEKESIDLQCDGETLTVAANGHHQQYDERIRLPVRVDERSASATFNNGVLEVTFDAVDESADIDVR